MSKVKKMAKVKENKPKVVSASNKAIAQMTPALQTEYRAIATKLTQQQYDEVLARFELGKFITTVVTDTRKYGENAVKLLATAMGMSETFLYNVKQLHTQWKDQYKELKAIASEKMPSGMTLSYSHFVFINTIPSATERLAMAKRCVAEGLSVEATKTAILEKYGKRSNNTGDISPRNPTAGTAVMSKALEKLTDSHDKIGTAVFDKIASEPETFAKKDTVDKLASLLKQTIEARRLLDEDIERLQDTIAMLKTSLEGSAVFADDDEDNEDVDDEYVDEDLEDDEDDEDEDETDSEDAAEDDEDDEEDDEDDEDIEEDDEEEEDDEDDDEELELRRTPSVNVKLEEPRMAIRKTAVSSAVVEDRHKRAAAARALAARSTNNAKTHTRTANA